MATGFEKFSKKALSEEPISLITKKEKPAAAQTSQPEEKPTAAVAGRVNRNPVPETIQAEVVVPAVTTAATAEGEGSAASKRGRRPKPDTGEEIFAMSIKVRMSTKLKLDELKFRQRMTIQDLCEEAFADLYDKYTK